MSPVARIDRVSFDPNRFDPGLVSARDLACGGAETN